MWLIAKNLFFGDAKKLIYLCKKYNANIVFRKNRKGNNMVLLSTLFDFIFPITTTSRFRAEEDVLESGVSSNEMIAINPANGMPMVGGMTGIDVTGNLWGQSESLSDESSCSSIDYWANLLDSGSMFDTGSMFDSCSTFD